MDRRNLKWQTNTDYIIRKASKRLCLLKVLKKYGARLNDMRRFYISAIRSILEYGAQVSHGGLTNAQSECIEKVQKRALRIIYSERDYEKILSQVGNIRLKVVVLICVLILFTRCLIPNINSTNHLSLKDSTHQCF